MLPFMAFSPFLLNTPKTGLLVSSQLLCRACGYTTQVLHGYYLVLQQPRRLEAVKGSASPRREMKLKKIPVILGCSPSCETVF